MPCAAATSALILGGNAARKEGSIFEELLSSPFEFLGDAPEENFGDVVMAPFVVLTTFFAVD